MNKSGNLATLNSAMPTGDVNSWTGLYAVVCRNILNAKPMIFFAPSGL